MAESRIEINLTGRDARLYDRVRGWIVSSRPNGRSGARDMLLLLPDMVTLLYRLIRDPRVPPGAKVIAVLGLTYAASPIDILPALLFGPIAFATIIPLIATAGTPMPGMFESPQQRSPALERHDMCPFADLPGI